jgi:hypothetical protein
VVVGFVVVVVLVVVLAVVVAVDVVDVVDVVVGVVATVVVVVVVSTSVVRIVVATATSTSLAVIANRPLPGTPADVPVEGKLLDTGDSARDTCASSASRACRQRRTVIYNHPVQVGQCRLVRVSFGRNVLLEKRSFRCRLCHLRVMWVDQILNHPVNVICVRRRRRFGLDDVNRAEQNSNHYTLHHIAVGNNYVVR